jgi:hypothetical protein
MIATAGEIDHGFVNRFKFRHMAFERLHRLVVSGAVGFTITQEPAAISGPQGFEVLLPGGSRRIFREGAEGKVHVCGKAH